MNGRCYKCNSPLTTGDFDGMCNICRKQSQEVKPKELEQVTLEQKALNGLADFIIMYGNDDDYDASAIEWHGILKTAIFELEDLRESTKECEKELNELKRDVKRFIELLMKDNHTGRDTFDIEILKDKLMKVGKEE